MKSAESVAMFCEAYQRLTLRNCEREALASQLRVLGDALGPLKPAPVSPDDVDWQAGLVMLFGDCDFTLRRR